MTVDEVKSIQERIKLKKDELTKAEGRREQLLAQLKTDFGCDTIQDALKLKDEYTRELEEHNANLLKLEQEIQFIIDKGVLE